jgi:hypothetical protein
VRDEAAFLRDVGATPASNTSVLITQGDKICSFIGTAGVTHAGLVQAMTGSVWTAAQAEAFMVNSETHLCPEKRYAPAVVTPAAPAAAPVAATPNGPAAPISAHDWQLVAKDPASHVGRSIIVYGHVTQFDAGTGTSGFLATVDGVPHKPQYGYANYPTSTALTGDPAALRDVVKGDLFTAEVAVAGPYTYPTTMGGQATVPMLTITKLTVTGHTAN